MDRREAEWACRGVRNLWPRSESEALRYRRRVVPCSPPIPSTYRAFPLDDNSWGWSPRADSERASAEYGCTVEHWRLGKHSALDDLEEQRVPKGYALVEWLAPDGRCEDHGDVERHGEHRVELSRNDGSWYRFQPGVPPHSVMNSDMFRDRGYSYPEPWTNIRCREAARFSGHEGDDIRRYRQHDDGRRTRWVDDGPVCGEFRVRDRVELRIGEEYVADGDGGWLRAVPRARLRAEDHAAPLGEPSDRFGVTGGNIVTASEEAILESWRSAWQAFATSTDGAPD